MFGKIFLKEWRENIPIFIITILMMFALIVLSFSGQRELTFNFTGMFLMLFLPFSGVLIGSSGFYSEFKDNAWIYLFSRPIKKERIWIFKYISLLSILLVIFLIFYLVKQFLPGLDEILKEINFPRGVFGLFSFSMYIVVPFLALTISFSISLLNDKPFIIFFVSILIGTGLAYLFRIYIEFLWETYWYEGGYQGFALLMAMSFIIASILTFIKSDFSQAGKKIFTFSKFVILFLVLSFGLGTVWIGKEDLFSGHKRFSYRNAIKYKGNVYTSSYTQGIIRYNSEKEKVEKIGGISGYIDPRFSISGDKIALFKEMRTRRRQWHRDLWIINTDGSQAKALIESHKKDSPFYKSDILWNCLLSSDGSKVAFLTYSRAKKRMEDKITIWWVNTDGSGLKLQMLNFPKRYYYYRLIAWPSRTNNIFLGVNERSATYKRTGYRIIKVNLEEGTYQVLTEVVKGERRTRVSPRRNYMALVVHDRVEKKEKLVIVDLRTLEEKIVYRADLIKLWAIRWSPNEDKIVFSMADELWVYYLGKNKARRIIKRNYDYEVVLDWLQDGKRLVVNTPVYGENFLKVLGEDFKEEKSIKVIGRIRSPRHIWGLDNVVLVEDQKKRGLWRLDLKTEKWKKVY